MFVRRLMSDRAGGVAILLALAMPVVVGGFGLGTEVGLWYFNQRKLQNAADVAAYAAAVEMRAGRSLDRVISAAEDAAVRAGLDPDRGSVVVVTPFGGSPDNVEVTLVEDLPRMFSGLFASGPVELGGRAVAQLTGGVESCVLALDPAARRALTFTGNTDTTITGCNVHANSLHDEAVYIDGNPRVTTDCVSTSGGVDRGRRDQLLTLKVCAAPLERARVVDDPYAHLPKPLSVMSEPCQPQNDFDGGSGASYVIEPGNYCGTLKIQRTVTMKPGVYVVDGIDFTSTAKITGEGVTIYLKGGGEFKTNGQADVRLTAPTSGEYKGVLVFADPPSSASARDHKINGTSTSHYEGAFYAPRDDVDIVGTNRASSCTQVVARRITFSGTSGLDLDCTNSFTTEIRSARLIRLVE